MTRLAPARAIAIVAWLSIIAGALSIVHVAGSLFMQRTLSVDLGVVDLFLGLGLLARRPSALQWAGLWIMFGIIGAVTALVYLAFAAAGTTIPMTSFGYPVANVSRSMVIVVVWVVLMVDIWRYRVLVRGDVRALFAAGEKEPARGPAVAGR